MFFFTVTCASPRLLLIYPETSACAQTILIIVLTEHAILILCHCIPRNHTRCSSLDNPFLPSAWKQNTFQLHDSVSQRR